MADNSKDSSRKQLSVNSVVATLSSQTQQWVMASVNDPNKGVSLPKGYNLGNEIETAMFYIAQNTEALQKCPQDSIVSALRDMALQGLSISKKQIYPIVYGNLLQMQRSYFGDITVLKQFFPYFEVTANVLYQGDKYAYRYDEIGNYYYITDVESSLENRDKPIIAAFGTIYDIRTKERIYGCVMTWNEIQKNWAKAKTHNVQNDFPQEMAKRTLIRRMCKLFINTSSNLSSEVVGAYNRSTDAEYDDDSLKNVTPPESEIEKQKLIKGKSQGTAGLSALLQQDDEKTAVDASISEEGEIIPTEQKNASEVSPASFEKKPESMADAHIRETAQESHSEDLLSDEIPF